MAGPYCDKCSNYFDECVCRSHGSLEDSFEIAVRSAKRQLKEMDASIDESIDGSVQAKPKKLTLLAKLSKWFKRTGEPGQVLEIIRVNHETGTITFEEPRWRVERLVAWWDIWVGVYIDRDKRKVYIFPIPCVGVVIYWG